ncbi:MAG: hypothetical protein E6Q93_14025 [Burkholderiaceae bacterium]|nr:MAG: hypothetical protein E6Q93_14025 [Burkholderiaceae bacterium]
MARRPSEFAQWVADLDVPHPPACETIDEFLESISQARGRPITVVDTPMPTRKVCGLWLGFDTADTIVISDQLRGVQRDHVIMHEVAHVVLDHEGVNGDLAGSILDGGLFATLDSSAVRRVLGRSRRYSEEQERNAELLGTFYQAGTRGLNRRTWINDSRSRAAAANLLGRR